jgi:glucokinase
VVSPDGDFVVAIDLGGTKTAVATADLGGRILAHARLQTEADLGGEQAVERALAEARACVAGTADETGGRCVAAGAVSPGIVLDDRVELVPNVPGLDRLALPDLLRRGLDLERVAVGNDVKAAAAAEHRWGSLRGADPAVFLSLGTGVAAAVLLGGRVLTGAHGAAGEIAYNLRGVADELGAADGRAPLEEFVGGRAIGERASRLLGGRLSAAEVFASTDVRARFLVDETLAELAVHVANLAILIDPARIAVGGGLMDSGHLVLAALENRVRFAVPFPPEIVPARFVHDAPLRGAIALAIECLARDGAADAVLAGGDELRTA